MFVATGETSSGVMMKAQRLVDKPRSARSGDFQIEEPLLCVSLIFWESDRTPEDFPPNHSDNGRDEVTPEQDVEQIVRADAEAGGDSLMGNLSGKRGNGIKYAVVPHTVQVNERIVAVNETELWIEIEQGQLTLQLGGQKLVVGVEEGDKAATTGVDAYVSSGAAPAVGLSDKQKPIGELVCVL
jgi:hypothetical protein